MAENKSVLTEAVIAAYDKYFKNAKTDADFMNAVMAYYKKYLVVLRMAVGGTQNELNRITLKYRDYTDDEHTLAWAGEIKALFRKRKVIKDDSFDPVEYLAVNYIAGHHNTSQWAQLSVETGG